MQETQSNANVTENHAGHFIRKMYNCTDASNHTVRWSGGVTPGENFENLYYFWCILSPLTASLAAPVFFTTIRNIACKFNIG